MQKKANQSEKMLFKLITWCTLYAFMSQTICCSAWAYSPPSAKQNTSVEEKSPLLEIIADLFVSTAHAETDEVKYTLTPENNEDDVAGNSVKPEEDDPSVDIGINIPGGGGGTGGTISGGSGSVNSVMGAYGYSYPIQVPPGRGGLAPQLAINYSSLAKNGWVGNGWNISVGYIERSTKNGKPGYTDRDTFTINLKGSSITLLKEGEDFRLKDEGMFLRVRKVESSLGTRWEATDKGGTIYSFGSGENSRQMAPEGIYKWCLDSIKDPNGNKINFSYNIDTPNNQIYLGAITYNEDTYIGFESEPNRLDTITSYATHFKVKTTRRLKRINVYQGRPLGTPIHRFELSYTSNELAKTSQLKSIQQFGGDGSKLPPVSFHYTSMKSPFGFKYLVESKYAIQNAVNKNFHMADFNGDGRTDYLVTPKAGSEDYWKLYLSDGNKFVLRSSGKGIYNNHKIVTGDFNGDGKADFLAYGGGHGADSSQAHLYFSTGSTFTNVKNVFLVESKKLYTGDFNGDGKTDILARYTKDGDVGEGPEPGQHGWKIYLANIQNGFDLASSWVDMPKPTPSINPEKQQIILGDYNGDGKTDVVMKPDVHQHNSSRLVAFGMYLSTGSRLELAKQGEHGNDQIPYRYDNVYPGDYNGDGKTDLLVTAGGYSMSTWEGYKLNISKGTDFATINVPLGEIKPSDGTPADLRPDFKSKIFPGDYNGDGLTDVIQSYHGTDGSTVYSLSRYLATGSGFEQHVERQIQSKTTQTRFFNGDFDGDGRLDILLVDKEQNVGKIIYNKAHYSGNRSVNLTTNNLLGKITHMLGATTEITYKPSTVWPKDIDGDGTYNPLPMALPTVSSVTSSDNMGEKAGTSVHVSTNTFAYEGGRYDIADKEFRGYGKVWVGDSTSNIVSESYYHQQPRFQGRLDKTITYLKPDILDLKIPIKDKESLKKTVETDNDWAAHSYKSYSETGEVIYRTFAHVIKNKVEKYDDTGKGLLSTVTTAYKFDRLGNLELENKWVNNHTNSKVITKCTKTTYNNDTVRWVIGMPANIQVGESASVGGEDPPLACGPALRETTMWYSPKKPMQLETIIQTVDKRWPNGKSQKIKVYTDYKYDSYGNRTWVSNPRYRKSGTTIDYSESKGMFPNLTTNALGHKVHHRFDPRFGTVTRATVNPGTPLEQVTKTTYDAFGRPDTITLPNGAQKSFFYILKPKHHSVRVESTSSPTIYTWYDNLDREILKRSSATNRKPIDIRTEYNVRGQLWRKTLPHFQGDNINFTYFDYDERGRLEQITNPDKTIRKVRYEGFTEHTTNEEGITKSIIKDSLGRLVQVNEPTGGQTTYEYDLFDNLKTIVDPLGNVTRLNYDQLGRKVEMFDPYMGHWQYGYDEAGNLVWQMNNDGRVINMEYDELNRLRFKRNISGNIGQLYIEHVYDKPLYAGGSSNSYSTGRLSRVITRRVLDDRIQNSVGYEYDIMGNVKEESTHINGERYIVKRQYDKVGRLDILTYPAPAKIKIDYDYSKDGRLESVWRINADNSREQLASYLNYNPLGQVGAIRYGNDTTNIYTYYPDNYRLKLFKVNGPSLRLIEDTYHYDKVGNVKRIVTGNYLGDDDYEYDYDNVNRLTGMKVLSKSPTQPGEKLAQTYIYDLNGNMIEKKGVGGFKITGWKDPNGHLFPTNVEYDNRQYEGIGSREVVYNEMNKPIQITYQEKKLTHLDYDGMGNRIKKSSGGNSTIYVGGIFEKRGSKERIYHIYAAGKRIATIKSNQANGNGKPYYIHGDHLGSTSLVTDSKGSKTERFRYLPFGSVLFHKRYVSNPLYSTGRKFTDQEYDEEYELYNYNARLYDPVMGRFITADTIVPDWTDPQSLNHSSMMKFHLSQLR